MLPNTIPIILFLTFTKGMNFTLASHKINDDNEWKNLKKNSSTCFFARVNNFLTAHSVMNRKLKTNVLSIKFSFKTHTIGHINGIICEFRFHAKERGKNQNNFAAKILFGILIH